MPKTLPDPEGEDVQVRNSKLHGQGLFAAVDIPRGSSRPSTQGP